MRETIARLVRLSLAFHHLNKTAESRFGLSLVQYQLLQVLRDMPGCSPMHLAEASGLHASTLTQSLKRLERKRLLFAEEDPRDSRKKILGITRKGHLAIERFRAAAGELLRPAVPAYGTQATGVDELIALVTSSNRSFSRTEPGPRPSRRAPRSSRTSLPSFS